MTDFSRVFDNTQAAGLVGQVADGIGGLALMSGLDDEIQAAVDHLQRQVGGWASSRNHQVGALYALELWHRNVHCGNGRAAIAEGICPR